MQMENVVGKVSHWNVLPQFVIFFFVLHSCKVACTVVSLQLAPDLKVLGFWLLQPRDWSTIWLETRKLLGLKALKHTD